MYANRYGTSGVERARVHMQAASDALDRRNEPAQPESLSTLLRSMLAVDAPSASRIHAEARAEWQRADRNAQGDGDRIGTGLVSYPGRRDAAMIDFAWLAREMTVQPGSAGGHAVGVDTADPVHALFADSIIGRTGVTVLTGLRGNVLIPRVTAQLSPTWLVPGATVASVNPSLGALSLTPKTVICTVDLSSQLLKQAPGSRDFVGTAVAQAVLGEIERTVLQGAGGEVPLGLANIPTAAGMTEISGAALTWATAVSAQRTLVAAGASDSALRWVAGATARETLQQRVRAAGTAEFVWQNGALADVPAYVTPRSPTASAFLGDWSHVVLGFWGNGVEIRLDPAQDFNKGIVAVQALAMVDVVVTQPAAFARIVSIS